MKTAKLFMNGRSQAVRLPKEFRLPGEEVRIHREGQRIILEPITDAWSEAFWSSFGAWNEDIPRLDSTEQLRDPFE
jgi:antitoxin VapB